MLDLLYANLLSPMILCFFLGIFARIVRSDLKIPPDFYTALTIFLLFAIGLKGGVELGESNPLHIWKPLLGTLLIGFLTPLVTFGVMMASKKFSTADAASIAAHYGSVSAVTFIASQDFVSRSGYQSEGFMPALLAFLECPGIYMALALGLAFRPAQGKDAGQKRTLRCFIKNLAHSSRDVLTGKSMILLVGGLIIGIIIGKEGALQVKPLFVDCFRGVLCIFLLELGLIVADRLDDLKKTPWFLLAFATGGALAFGIFGVWMGHLTGLSPGGATVAGTMAASASYIAAPPAVRATLPEANLPMALTAALVITFPFNLVVGIPLYFSWSLWLAS